MRSRLFQTGLALVLLGIAAPDSAISQTAPQVRNAPDFAGIIAGYRTQRAKDPDSCCTYSAPVFGREVRFYLFGTFEPAYEAKNDRQMILEFVPRGESVQNWTRMITLSAFRGTGSAPISTAEMQQRFFNTNRGCETASFSRVIASGRFADGTEYNLSSNGCGSTAAAAIRARFRAAASSSSPCCCAMPRMSRCCNMPSAAPVSTPTSRRSAMTRSRLP